MTVISISIPDKLLQAIDDILEDEGYTSRSEFMRSLIREYLEERAGTREAIASLIIVLTDHDESLKVDQKVIETIHKYQGIVRAFYHQIIEENLCLNIAIVDVLPVLSELLKALRRLRGVRRVWMIKITK
ncbi:MAG: CopG family ribbon-helix-helix protein [Desulfurococcales archaeon]|nr:CopG family ribbon-helix-helix protein [Desulfurococcales archaeon]MCE4629014.1 CopG family ribbon-helix-helix protein [Desulfurococcales archaeon]